MRINSAEWIGVAALGAARVEKKIVKVPENEVGVTLRRSKAVVGSTLNLEKHPAINQQRQEFNAGKTVLPTKLFDLARRRK
jgi:hypothetical protein